MRLDSLIANSNESKEALGEVKLGIMGSESHLLGEIRFFVVFGKITLYNVWFIIYALKFAPSKNQGYS